MEIQIRINTEGALHNQRYAFTDRFTLISELLQNARRAGATLIEISHDEESCTLRVRDNGQGLDDFQKLLTFHESGWSQTVRQHDMPFGIGFSKCLYAATRCVVRSNGHEVDFETASALAQQPINVRKLEPCVEEGSGMVVELYGVELPELAARISQMCRGFPVDIEFNGSRIDRPDALDAVECRGTPVGAVHLIGTDDGRSTRYTRIYLQGFCVHRMPACYDGLRDAANIVHLDSTRFLARLPDRDKLIDEEEQIPLVQEELARQWRWVLEDCKAKLSPTVFVRTFYASMKTWGHLDLLDDVPVLPIEICETVEGYPTLEPEAPSRFMNPPKAPLTREEIEAGSVRLVELGDPAEDNMAHWMLARELGFVAVDVSGLKRTHWVHQYVRKIHEEPVSVEPLGDRHKTKLECRWVWADVELCDRVRVQVSDDIIELKEDGLCFDNTLFIPSGEVSGCAVLQASSFIDSYDHFHEDDQDAEVDALEELISRHRAVDAKLTLLSMLEALKLDRYPVLQGKTFRLAVGQTAQEFVLEPLD